MSAKKSMVSGFVRINGPRAIACAAAALVAACGGNAANELSARARGVEVVTANGKSINGKSINGKSINGKSINGSMLNGKSINGTDLTDIYLMSVQLDSPQIDGATVEGVSLHGTVFTGSLGGTNLNPADFARAVFHGQLSDGTNLNVRFDQYALLSTAGGDLNSYAVSYETDSGWVSLCGTEADGSPVMAIPVNGQFDYSQGTSTGGVYDSSGPVFTPTCRHYAAAKCVEMGYQPWATSPAPLEAYFQTCTRVLRADYCGDGTSFTVDGTLINIYDRLGVQTDTETWMGEAEWGPKGALCMAPQQLDRFQNTNSTPSCYATLMSETCGSGFSNAATLIIDEYSH
ncbi:MAG: ADYC domain-containing protein [Myxococcales bacterium]